MGLSGAEDDSVASLDLPGDFFEERDLRGIEIGSELHVRADEPPAVRQLQGEVASHLRKFAASQPLVTAEQARKRDETVVPVVVPGNRECLRMRRLRPRKRRLERGDQLLFVEDAARCGVNLVPAENEDSAAPSEVAFPFRILEGQVREGGRLGYA